MSSPCVDSWILPGMQILHCTFQFRLHKETNANIAGSVDYAPILKIPADYLSQIFSNSNGSICRHCTVSSR